MFKKKIKNNCDRCGSALRYIEQYKRWYCDNCKLYSEEEGKKPTNTLKTKTVRENKTPPPQEEQIEAEIIEQQKRADMDYFRKIYGSTAISKEESPKILYGILAEVKTLNYQIAHLIKLTQDNG